MTSEPPKYSLFIFLMKIKNFFFEFDTFVLIFFNDSVKNFYFFEAHLKSFIDAAADCLEKFTLFLIKQNNKIKKKFVKKRVS